MVLAYCLFYCIRACIRASGFYSFSYLFTILPERINKQTNKHTTYPLSHIERAEFYAHEQDFYSSKTGGTEEEKRRKGKGEWRGEKRLVTVRPSLRLCLRRRVPSVERRPRPDVHGRTRT